MGFPGERNADSKVARDRVRARPPVSARDAAVAAAAAGLCGASPGPRMHRASRHVPFRHFVVCSRDCVEFDSSTSVRKHRRAKRPRVDPLGAVGRATHRADRHARVARRREFA